MNPEEIVIQQPATEVTVIEAPVAPDNPTPAAAVADALGTAAAVVDMAQRLDNGEVAQLRGELSAAVQRIAQLEGVVSGLQTAAVVEAIEEIVEEENEENPASEIPPDTAVVIPASAEVNTPPATVVEERASKKTRRFV